MNNYSDKDKWILYKHTSNYELIKAVALDVKNSCATDISDIERSRMQDRLSKLNLYKTRDPKAKPLDSINHRINTLKFFMFGYEDIIHSKKRFIFSPLGNLFLSYINDENKQKFIFTSMLFAIQFEHPANGTPSCFQLYPFRLLFKLMTDKRLDYKIYNSEYAYILSFVKNITVNSYEDLIQKILNFRKLSDNDVINLLKENEEIFVKSIYEWQYYMQKLLSSIGILDINNEGNLIKLYHPQNPNSSSPPTGRMVKKGYVKISKEIYSFIEKMLGNYSAFSQPLKLNNNARLQIDTIKEIYSFYPSVLLEEIGEEIDNLQSQLLNLPKLIDEYSKNPNNKTAYKFEEVLSDGFNMFYNIEAKTLGGAGRTDIECLYLSKNKKFAVEAKSTSNKLLGINAGRLRCHRNKIGGEYTIVITSRYVPAIKYDIYGEPIVIILASTFSEYLYNHLYHDLREIDFNDFDSIICNNLGKDVSKIISNMTLEKFASNN